MRRCRSASIVNYWRGSFFIHRSDRDVAGGRGRSDSHAVTPDRLLGLARPKPQVRPSSRPDRGDRIDVFCECQTTCRRRYHAASRLVLMGLRGNDFDRLARTAVVKFSAASLGRGWTRRCASGVSRAKGRVTARCTVIVCAEDQPILRTASPNSHNVVIPAAACAACLPGDP